MSVVLPVRNCEHTIAVAIRSILVQELDSLELLVIDDGSDDRTMEVVSSFAADTRVVIASDGRRRGLPGRLNEGVERARGEFVARMDGDDVSYPARLRNQAAFLDAHPDVDLVGTAVLVFGHAGRAIGKRAFPESHQDICRCPRAGFPLAHPTYCGRREWFRKQAYHEVPRAEDQELLFRAHPTSRFANLPDVLLGYREESVRVGNVLRARRSWVGVVVGASLRSRRPLTAVRVVAEQCAKAAVDVAAVVTGLERRLLAHRARPVTADEIRAWDDVWARCSGSVQSVRG